MVRDTILQNSVEVKQRRGGTYSLQSVTDAWESVRSTWADVG